MIQCTLFMLLRGQLYTLCMFCGMFIPSGFWYIICSRFFAIIPWSLRLASFDIAWHVQPDELANRFLRRVLDPHDAWSHAPWRNYDEWRTIWARAFTPHELAGMEHRRLKHKEQDERLLTRLRNLRHRRKAIMARIFGKQTNVIFIGCNSAFD